MDTEFISKILSILQNVTKLLCLWKKHNETMEYVNIKTIFFLNQKDYGPKLSSSSEQKNFLNSLGGYSITIKLI